MRTQGLAIYPRAQVRKARSQQERKLQRGRGKGPAGKALSRGGKFAGPGRGRGKGDGVAKPSARGGARGRGKHRSMRR